MIRNRQWPSTKGQKYRNSGGNNRSSSPTASCLADSSMIYAQRKWLREVVHGLYLNHKYDSALGQEKVLRCQEHSNVFEDFRKATPFSMSWQTMPKLWHKQVIDWRCCRVDHIYITRGNCIYTRFYIAISPRHRLIHVLQVLTECQLFWSAIRCCLRAIDQWIR